MSSEGARANRADVSVLAGLSNHLDLYFKIPRKEAAGCNQGLPRAAPVRAATFPNNRPQSWLHVRIIWETWKRSTPRGWLLAEMLKPIHWAEDMNSNNSRSLLLSRDEKDIAMHWSREISISLTFRISNYFIPFDLPSTGAIALSWY